MQIYDALPILTAHPDAEERAQAPHHLYGVLKPHESTNADHWQNLAQKEIDAAHAQGKHPIIVGGTGFYIRSLIEGLSPIPDVSPDIREELEQKHRKLGQDAFYEAFKTEDPIMAAKLMPQDKQRNMRAWEVLIATGKSLSEWQDMPLTPPPSHYRFHMIAMTPDREALCKKIRDRIEIMLELGALDEIKDLQALIETGEVQENALIVKAHGFRPFRSYLQGQWTLEEAIECTEIETRQYAKRQVNWLKSQYNRDNDKLTIEDFSC